MTNSKRIDIGVVLRVVTAALVGCFIGAACYGVVYAKMPSYLGSDPQTCANCHVMQDNLDSWEKGPHARVATCNDCHLPHDSIVAKYLVKAEDGVLHGYKFTVGNYPDNIVIRESSLEIANASCLSCHDNLTTQMRYTMGIGEDEISCVRCHSGIGH